MLKFTLLLMPVSNALFAVWLTGGQKTSKLIDLAMYIFSVQKVEKQFQANLKNLFLIAQCELSFNKNYPLHCKYFKY